ncbi:MAG: transglycosylase SLT domain-containing protein, partial [Thermomicrobium sp.]|nr:transglycosylase SLT domain-containing protein [Thermomicrobium sp.]
PAAGEAAVIAARALAALGEPEQAADHLLAARASLPDLGPYLEYRALDLLVASGRTAEAEQMVDRIVATAPIRRLAVAALEWRRARAQARGDVVAVREAVTRLLDLATIPSYRATLLVQRARAARELGDLESARADLVAAVETAPDSAGAAQALDELSALGMDDAIPLEQRAAIVFAAGRYAAAIAAASAIVERDPTRADAWYRRAIARVRNGDLATGIAELAAMVERYPQDDRTPDALVTAGRLVEWSDEGRAEELYSAVVARYPGSAAAAEATFRHGLLAFGRGEVDRAARLWEPLATAGDVRAGFWYGKALAAAGDLPGARRIWQQVTARQPQGFYGTRAAELLRGEAPTVQTAIPRVVDSLQPDDRPLRAWLMSLGETPETATRRLEASSAARRALLLLDLGDRDAAGWEVDAARDELQDDPLALVWFGWECLRRGETAYAYRVGLRAAMTNGVPRDVVSPLLLPVPYPEVLGPISARFGVDPLLLAALIRQESAFEPTAVSPVGARGLTQVMPDTGAALARQLGFVDWTPDDLFHPVTSLALGAAELARRLHQFDGQLYLALASYNAGAGAVQQWLRERPAADPDLFAERIPYRETYAYVQQVYANYRAYQVLYASG